MKAGVGYTIPVRLAWASNRPLPATGVAAATLTLNLVKQDNSVSTKSLNAGVWTEVNVGAVPGEYRVVVHAHETDQAGYFTLHVRATGIDQYDDRFWLDPYNLTDVHGEVNGLQTSIDDVHSDLASNYLRLSQIKQAVMGKHVLDLTASPPRHVIYDTDGVSILQQAEVEDTASERRYTPI